MGTAREAEWSQYMKSRILWMFNASRWFVQEMGIKHQPRGAVDEVDLPLVTLFVDSENIGIVQMAYYAACEVIHSGTVPMEESLVSCLRRGMWGQFETINGVVNPYKMV